VQFGNGKMLKKDGEEEGIMWRSSNEEEVVI
jgi:hypothetical protein